MHAPDLLERPASASPLGPLAPGAVVIHGGQYKSGSTAVQNALAANAAALARQGWVYPQAGRIQDPTLGHRHLPLMQEVRYGKALGAWARLREAIDGHEQRVLLSHEGFFSPELPPQALAAQLPGREVHVVVYLRHPVDHVESGWREWVRRWRFTGSPRDWYQQRQAWLQIDAQRQAWETVFGRGHVHFRAFARERFAGGSVVQDLAGMIGLDGPLAEPEGLANGSLNARQTLVAWVATRTQASAAQRDALLDMLWDPALAQQMLSQLDELAAAAGFDDGHKAALARVLQGVSADTRVLADALAHEIEARYLPLFMDELQAQGQGMGDAAHPWQGQWRRQAHDAGLSDAALLRAIASLLGC